MSHLRIEKALAEIQGVRKDGNAFLLGEDLDVTIYAALGEEALQIARVSRIELGPEIATISNHKGERFFVPPERLIALKTGAPSKTVSSSAGFRA